MMNRLLLLIISISLFAGCAHQEEKKAKAGIDTTCQSLMGCKEEDVLLQLGVPQNSKQVGDVTVYKYRKALGARIEYSGLWATSEMIDRFDEFEIFFKNGTATSWKTLVKR